MEHFAVTGVKEHVVGVVHNCLVSIPWAMMWPSFSDVELMVKVGSLIIKLFLIYLKDNAMLVLFIFPGC